MIFQIEVRFDVFHVFGRENCGVHRSDGLGNWSCDMPTQQLRKLMSRQDDVVATSFFRRFELPGAKSLLNLKGRIRNYIRANAQDAAGMVWLASYALTRPRA